ncbi:hypothetical protein ACFRI7_03005 [Streptomyces sp. NPDC056716]|uniref:hypothetical protein n=1 Tax=unclassified Streptomyces TaxID=2593676 RepID=UPI003673C619
MTRATNRSGASATAEYDLLGCPTTTQYGVDAAGQAESTVAYDYYANDLLKEITDSQAGSQTFAYDTYTRLTSTTGPSGTVGYGYDAADRTTSMTAARTTTTYGYDPSDILTYVTSGGQEVTFGLDPAGRETTATLPGGITRTTDVIESISYARDAQAIGDSPTPATNAPSRPGSPEPSPVSRCQPPRAAHSSATTTASPATTAAPSPTTPTASSPATAYAPTPGTPAVNSLA